MIWCIHRQAANRIYNHFANVIQEFYGYSVSLEWSSDAIDFAVLNRSRPTKSDIVKSRKNIVWSGKRKVNRLVLAFQQEKCCINFIYYILLSYLCTVFTTFPFQMIIIFHSYNFSCQRAFNCIINLLLDGFLLILNYVSFAVDGRFHLDTWVVVSKGSSYKKRIFPWNRQYSLRMHISFFIVIFS